MKNVKDKIKTLFQSKKKIFNTNKKNEMSKLYKDFYKAAVLIAHEDNKIENGGGMTGNFIHEGSEYWWSIIVDDKGNRTADIYGDMVEALFAGVKTNIFEQIYYIIKHFFEDLISNIKHTYQRATKGYCDADIWEIDNWFSTIFPKMLRELKMKPAYMPTDGKGNVVYNQKVKAKGGYKEWQQILEHMAKCFEKTRIRDDNDDFIDKNPYDIRKEAKKYREWEKRTQKIRQDNLKEGMRCFEKYFWHLGW